MTLLICKKCGDKNYLKLIRSDKDLRKFISIENSCNLCRKDTNV